MHVLAFNSGSSSIKAALVDTVTRRRLLDVRVLNLHTSACVLVAGEATESLSSDISREHALERLLAIVSAKTREAGIDAAVHRVVHGGNDFSQPVLLDDTVLQRLQETSALAPLHNPPALAIIDGIRRTWPSLPNIAVFDTAFHATLPRRAREYALPAVLSAKQGIRRYGFHGISHAHVSTTVASFLHVEPQTLRVISCHLGNGSSVAAIEYGRSVDTSMGMTPLEGLVMGTRAGDLDPGVILHLLRDAGLDATSLGRLLNEQSGLKGLTGTEDMRDIENRAATGDEACRLAIALYAHRVRKYIGAYAAVMGGVDVIAFTGGIGEHSAVARHRIAQRLEFLGASLDEDRNRDARPSLAAPVAAISSERSRTRLVVVMADEELAMALAAADLLVAPRVLRDLPAIPVAVSARHAHLSQATLDQLFGPGYRLTRRNDLSQPGQFAAEETVSLVGSRGRIDLVRVLGPPRDHDQVEISRSDEFVLGIDAPVRISGDITNTPGLILEGPHGRATLKSGVICAHRHIYMHPDDAVRFGLRDHDSVAVRIGSGPRALTFDAVAIRVSPAFRLEMHVDVDEANAAGLHSGESGELLVPTATFATVAVR